jgi:gamma-glutamylcyclotransferase (GGCT)/AIG2-like uncharacterized protein YtfP
MSARDRPSAHARTSASRGGASERLAVYGSLAPGKTNNGELAGLDGTWTKGSVKGRLKPDGWGAALGYPGLVLDPSGGDVQVCVFASRDLPQHWARLDAFEGAGYRRTVATVTTADGAFEAFIYVFAESA